MRISPLSRCARPATLRPVLAARRAMSVDTAPRRSDTTVDAQAESDKLKEFLDTSQYTATGILRYEKIFGAGYVSSGGPRTTELLVPRLNLKQGQKVLDVGCGIGGGDFYMAEAFGADVTGIDLSENMLAVAHSRNYELSAGKVEFLLADATLLDYPDGHFDVIYSRDTILHIDDKNKLFSQFFSMLKPGGKLMITDYCCGTRPPTEEFKDYVAQRDYALLSPGGYGKALENAGFEDVSAEDYTGLWTEVLEDELTTMEGMRKAFMAEFSVKDYHDLRDGWRNKLQRCDQGDQKWGYFFARKSNSI